MGNNNGDKGTWHAQRASRRELMNRTRGSDEDVRDQWISRSIKRHDDSAPENALTSLRTVYENRAKLINYNCLDSYNTVHKPNPKARQPQPQQPHVGLDQIYVLERIGIIERPEPEPNTGLLSCFKFKMHKQNRKALEDDESHNYVMKCMESMESHVPDGRYVYTIYSDMPQVVVCTSGVGAIGHSSVVKGRIFWCRRDASQPLPNDEDIDYTKYPVMLAGELFFNQGKLIRWNNRSGHYRPMKQSVLEFGAAAHILPRKLFVNSFG
ncbi:hypothetical protein FE392_12045 [Xenorhabdus sp. 12]|uniref:Uncharacterized protein n=1 Tax=Xenorhabdus santafensis TaxID=2582833 RepID=A0ABU4SB76_9GAMM|nr:hypothetical protein [Xenorhabdus sp. 12]MDX7988056.1 hypothetical protein [Xenorhabdus sp. 12]